MKNSKKTYGIEVGDKVRFSCQKTDEDGWSTDKVMKVTGRCIFIELNHPDSPHFPKFHVRRSGIDYWYFGDNIKILQKGKRPINYNFKP